MAAFFPTGSKFELIYGIGGALIFSGYILVDTQLVMRHYQVEEEIAAAISLYLDVINLFLSILRILNSSVCVTVFGAVMERFTDVSVRLQNNN